MDQFKLLTDYVRTVLAGRRGDEGATAVEYSLLAALIAGVCIIAISAFGTHIGDVFTNLTNQIKF
ncbi:Flp family type IVb pilin [Actinoplanes sp. NPDC051851]|uniref:Flp family type IVb pilin n=1 Tax=Actinoplanes sp. NPDC051851 TaxID=3154753 RepID=UPI00343EB64A